LFYKPNAFSMDSPKSSGKPPYLNFPSKILFGSKSLKIDSSNPNSVKNWKQTGFRLFVRLFSCHSLTTTVSELTRGSSTGAGNGKGHVKSASVSSPGPSAADASTNSAQQSDSLGARYNVPNFSRKTNYNPIPNTNTHIHTHIHTF